MTTRNSDEDPDTRKHRSLPLSNTIPKFQDTVLNALGAIATEAGHSVTVQHRFGNAGLLIAGALGNTVA